MDKKLLDALNNLSDSLDLISQTLAEKKAESSTSKALEEGNFSAQIKEISNGIKKLQSDNQKILKNQNTILAMSKKKEDKTSVIGDVGTDKKQESNIKKGVGTILLIAVAVLAIGMAFKLVGNVNFLSVIGLALAITIISIAFEKIAKLKLTTKQAYETSLVIVMISGAITISSWILSLIRPIGFRQAITGILIGVMFAALSKNLANVFVAAVVFDKLKVSPAKLVLALLGISAAITASSWVLSLIRPIGLGQAVTAILISIMFSVISYNLHKIAGGVVAFEKTGVKPGSLVKTLLGISAAIVASSWVLSLTKPIGFGQAITAILIGAMFAVVSFNLGKIATGVIAFEKTKVKATSLIMVLVGIATAITASSWILSLVKPLGFQQVLTAIVIAVMFAAMSYIMPQLALGLLVIEKYIGKSKIWLIPVVFIAISIAIMVSSAILSKTTPVPFMLLLKILVMSIVLAVSAVVLGIAAAILAEVGVTNILKGSVAIIIIAATIMVSSWLLDKGTYKNYPDWKWALGVGLSLIMFSAPIILLGIVAMSGIGALAILAGAAMTLLVASTIVGTSYILSTGIYNNYPNLNWATGVGLSLTAFGMGMLALGSIALTGIGYLAILAGSSIILTISETIVEAASILSKGKFTGGPSRDWAEGISLALGAFTPIYGMLMANSIMSIFGGGVSPDDFSTAIMTISNGIVTAADVLGKSPGIWKNGPSKAWAEGVGTAIGAFAPVYKVLSESKGWFSSGPSVGEMKESIMTISQGIVDAANFFGQNTASFDISKIPTREWGENVGNAIGAFMPALDFISKNSGIFSDGTDILLDGISAVSAGIVSASVAFADGKFTTSIPPGWIDSISGNIKAYVDLAKYVSSNYESTGGGIVGAVSSAIFGSNNPMDNVIDGMVKLGNAYSTLGNSIKNFGNSISGIDIEKLSTIRAFTSNIVLMSLMDPDMFEDMLDKLEEKAGVMVDMISDINESGEKADKNKLKGVTKGGGSTANKPDPTQQKILQVLASMDSKLGTIAKNSSTLADYTNEIRTGSGVKIKK